MSRKNIKESAVKQGSTRKRSASSAESKKHAGKGKRNAYDHLKPKPATHSADAEQHSQGKPQARRGMFRRHEGRSSGPEKLLLGMLSAHPDGFGFVAVEGREKDVFLPREEMHGLMHGDEVEVRVKFSRGRESGEFVRMVREASPIMVAQLLDRGGVMMAQPRSKRFTSAILIRSHDLADAKSGDWVRIEIKRGGVVLEGKILEVLGQALTPTTLIDLVITEQALETEFPDDVERQATGIPLEVQASDMQGRMDLQHLPFVTIDGEDARDFDDAICVLPRGGGFEVWVAIADVAHYVHENTALDREAAQRGNSFYFPDRVIPMLSEKLSNGLCSLNPHVPRLAMTVRMRFDEVGKRRAIQVYESVICSQARLTYTQVAKFLEDADASAIDQKQVLTMLDDAHRLFHVLRRKRDIRGALDLDLPEVRAKVVDGKLEGMLPQQRNVAHMLIEELMLAANTAVVEYIEAREAVFLYRVHPEPKVESIETLNTYLVAKGKFIPTKRAGKRGEAKGGLVDPRDVQAVLQFSYGKPYAHVLHRLILRSMQQAFYTTHKQGHFGLAYQAYGHFTSPIRRYADLTLHRCLKTLVHHQKQKVNQEKLEVTAQHLSVQERKQQRAEWDTQAMLAALYHQQDVGKRMMAVISGLTSRRIFMELDTTLAEASCAVDDLAGVFTLDEQGHALVARRGGARIELGDKIEVEINSVDPVRGQIIATLV